MIYPNHTQPLISCIMPTADRRGFVPQAIGYFLRQDYENTDERRAIWQRHLPVNHKLGAIGPLRLQYSVRGPHTGEILLWLPN